MQVMMWEDFIPEDWISKDGRLWRDMSQVERQIERWNNPSLSKQFPKSYRDSRAKKLREYRALVRAGAVRSVHSS